MRHSRYTREGPFLKRRLLYGEEARRVLAISTTLNAESEFFIGHTCVGRLTPIDGRVDLQADVEELAN